MIDISIRKITTSQKEKIFGNNLTTIPLKGV